MAIKGKVRNRLHDPALYPLIYDVFDETTLSISAAAEETEQIDKQVHKIKIERECAPCGYILCLLSRCGGKHSLYLLGVPCCEPYENCYAYKTDYPLHLCALQEYIHHRADD